MTLTFFTILHILLIVLIYFSKKITGGYWFDMIISIVFIGISIWLFILYDNSLENKLRSLGNVVYLIATIGFSLLILLIVAFIQKRWFLTTPIILLFVFWLGTLLFNYYQKTQEITYNNFSEKFPKIQQAISTNNLELFDSEIKLHKNKLQKIEYLVYYFIKPDHKHLLEFFDKLIANGFINTDAFVLIIENHYKNTTYADVNTQASILAINNLLFDKRHLDYIYDITKLLEYDIKYLFIKDFLRQLKIHNQNISIPFYLYDEFNPQKLVRNGLENIAVLDDSKKQAYFNLLRLVVENSNYFFNNADFMQFKINVKDDIKYGYRGRRDIKQQDAKALNEIFKESDY